MLSSLLELYLNAEFYCKHPCFLNILSSDNISSDSLANLICMSVSHASLDSDLKGVDLVKAEAIAICKNVKMCSGFLCIMALSFITGRNILTFYPDFGCEKYIIMFNLKITPRASLSSSLNLYTFFILF